MDGRYLADGKSKSKSSMSYPDDSIERLLKGYRPTLLETNKGNELIDALNSLRVMTIESGDDDKVELSTDGVKIIYKGTDSDVTDQTIKLIDANDITKVFEIKIENGIIKSIKIVDSEYVEKTITICEDGSSVDYTFIVKS